MFSLLVWAGLNYAWCLSVWPQEYYSYPVCLSGPQWSFSIHSRPALLLIEHFEIWVNVLISWLSPSVGEILIREFGLVMISFRKRKPHLHNWVSGGILSDWQLVISGLKCLSRSNIRTLFQLFVLTLKSQLALDFSVLLSCTFFFFCSLHFLPCAHSSVSTSVTHHRSCNTHHFIQFMFAFAQSLAHMMFSFLSLCNYSLPQPDFRSMTERRCPTELVTSLFKLCVPACS